MNHRGRDRALAPYKREIISLYKAGNSPIEIARRAVKNNLPYSGFTTLTSDLAGMIRRELRIAGIVIPSSTPKDKLPWRKKRLERYLALLDMGFKP